jgi:hypothetical protein
VRGLAARLALLAGVLLLVAALLEAAARLFTDAAPPLTEKDPRVGQRYIRGLDQEVYVAEAGRRVHLRFNRDGFRGPDRPLEKPAGVRRIAVLGDSMIASLGVDEEQTMVCQLQELLNRDSRGERWEVLNFGVAGAGPGQELALYRELASRYQPDIVIDTFFVGNDLADNCRRLSNNPRIYFDLDEEGRLRQVPLSAGKVELSQFLNHYSRFYVWQKDAVNALRHIFTYRNAVMESGQWVFCTRPSGDYKYAWRISEELVREFQREAAAHGSLFLQVVLPSCEQIYADSFQILKSRAGPQAPAFDPDYPDRRLAAVCRRAGIPFLTMTAEFRAAAPHASSHVEAEWLFLQGYGHFSRRGNEICAQAVHRVLAQGDPHALAGRPLLGLLPRQISVDRLGATAGLPSPAATGWDKPGGTRP